MFSAILVAALLPLIEITPDSSLVDANTNIIIRNLHSHEIVSVVAEAKDDQGREWASKAVFEADNQGIIDLSA